MKLSIIIPTLNNEKNIDAFFISLQKQSYPKTLMEIIAVDGGSGDKTIKLLKEHNVKVFHNPYRLAEPGVTIGMKQAKGELIMILATDNFFHDRHALKTIVDIFDDRKIFAALPIYGSEKTYSIFSKYHNYFTDPFNHFVYGDAANNRTFHRIYKTIEHNDVYDIYDFRSSSDKPLMALAQGFIIRSCFNRQPKDRYDDIEPIMKLITQGKYIACVHSVAVYHNTIRDLNHFMRKQRWATLNALQNKPYGIFHRLNSLSSNQRLRIKLWPVYAFSFILPLMRSLIGVIQDKECIWLFHPVNCFLSAWASLTEIISYNIRKVNSVSRQ